MGWPAGPRYGRGSDSRNRVLVAVGIARLLGLRSRKNHSAVPPLACGHHDRVKMPAACCPTVMAGHVQAIRSESLSRLVAGTRPAMTVGRTSVRLAETGQQAKLQAIVFR